MGARCTKTFTLTESLTAPVYFYYGFKGFYQNHRRYLKYYSSTQLSSGTIDATAVTHLISRYPLTAEITSPMLRLMEQELHLSHRGLHWSLQTLPSLVVLSHASTTCYGLKSEASVSVDPQEQSAWRKKVSRGLLISVGMSIPPVWIRSGSMWLSRPGWCGSGLRQEAIFTN